jgi:hypothetical protein
VRVALLRHDALKAELASVREHERAVVVVEVLVEAQVPPATILFSMRNA